MVNHCRKKSSSKHKQLKRRIVIIFNIKNEKFPQEVEEFYDEIEYESILWLGGFVKTTLSAALIGSGASVLLSGLCNHPFLLQNPFYNSIVGLMSLIIGVIIVYLIDVERRNYKKKEIQVYQEKYKEDVEKLNEVYKKELLKQANVIAFQMVNESLHDMEDELEDNSY
nr:hypothetical protein [uncultured Methanobrevibacter sp.]